tara:strand:- start:4587 stop:4850 length:264 start_codon:yes stop_codon:yes gene_type:complete
LSNILPSVSQLTSAFWRLFGFCSSPFSNLVLLVYFAVIVSATSLYFKEHQPLFVGNSMIEIFGHQERPRQDIGTGYFAFNGSDERRH